MANSYKKIINFDEIVTEHGKLLASSKQLVLAGGCFDILHEGHLTFLTESKKQGDTLILLLESDARIRKLKGEGRPINSQTNRARILSHLPFVDHVILLPDEMTNELYDQLILEIKPAIITTTENDPYRMHKERQAKLVQGKVISVIKRLPNMSTTQFAQYL